MDRGNGSAPFRWLTTDSQTAVRWHPKESAPISSRSARSGMAETLSNAAGSNARSLRIPCLIPPQRGSGSMSIESFRASQWFRNRCEDACAVHGCLLKEHRLHKTLHRHPARRACRPKGRQRVVCAGSIIAEHRRAFIAEEHRTGIADFVAVLIGALNREHKMFRRVLVCKCKSVGNRICAKRKT